MERSLEQWTKPDESIITALERLFDQKKLMLASFFIGQPDKQFSLSEVQTGTKIPLTTLHRHLKLFRDTEIVYVQEIKNLKLYSLKKNPLTMYLSKFIGVERRSPLQDFIQKASRLSGVSYIIQYGKEEERKVNVLLVGEIGNIPEAAKEADNLVRGIKNQYNFKINHLCLTKDQYHQMTHMGLYSGQKTVVFKK